MYKTEIQKELDAGTPVRRGSWPKGDKLYSLQNDVTLTLDAREQKALGLKKTSGGYIPKGTLVYVSGDSAQVGYELNYEDRQCQDWESIPAK